MARLRAATPIASVLIVGVGLWWGLRSSETVSPTDEKVDDRELGNSLERQPHPTARGWWSVEKADRQAELGSDEPGIPHFAIQAAPEPGETTPEWTALSRSDRLTRLEAQFEAAVADLESGSPEAAARAEAALTALRPELYTTPEGREHHIALESRLEILTENE